MSDPYRERTYARRPPPPGERSAVGERGELLTQGQVEQEIMRLSHEMEDLTVELVKQAREAAGAEAAYKKSYHQWRAAARVTLDGNGPGGRVTNEEAQDYAVEKVTDSNGTDLLAAHLLSEAVFTAARDALRAKQSQIDALRTISANIRGQT